MRITVFRWSSLVFLTLLAAVGAAQDSTKRNDRPKSEAAPSPVARKTVSDQTHYTWEFAQPQFVVNHIVIEHDTLGRGKVSFDRKAEAETIVEPIELSPQVLERIEKLWRTLNFLESKKNYQA